MRRLASLSEYETITGGCDGLGREKKEKTI